METFNILYVSMTLTVRKGEVLPSPERMSIFFDGLRIETSKGLFDLYEDNNCDFEYDFRPITNGYEITFKVKGACWYQMDGLDHPLDWEEDKLDLTLDDIFDSREIELGETLHPITEIALDICDDDDKSYTELGTISVQKIEIDEYQEGELRELGITNSSSDPILVI